MIEDTQIEKSEIPDYRFMDPLLYFATCTRSGTFGIGMEIVSQTRFRIFLSEIDKDSSSHEPSISLYSKLNERESDRKEIPCLAIFSIEEFIDRFIKCENTSFFKFILPLSSNFKRIFFLYFFSIKNYLYYYIRSIKFILKNVIGIFIFIMLPFIICNSLLLLDSK